MSLKQDLVDLIYKSLVNLDDTIDKNIIQISDNKDNIHGDFSSNVCLKLKAKLNKTPQEIGQYLIDNIKDNKINKIECVGVGFLNFYINNDVLFSQLKEIAQKGKDFGKSTQEKAIKVNLEYVSANPTGYLHLGHARGAAVGDSLSRIMTFAGYDVTREYYINDAGNQVNNLGESLRVRYLQALGKRPKMPENGYYGNEIKAVAKELVKKIGEKYKDNSENKIKYFRDYGIKALLNQIKKDLKAFRVEFDIFTSETSVRKSGKIEEAIKNLKSSTYVLDGATYLNTTKDGDDKDRVIIKSDGSYAYILPDIAYHNDKYQRGFDLLVDVLGADHHGYIARLKSAMKSLGNDESKLVVPLIQIVRLFKNGEEFRMSKRTGNAISMNELIKEVGIDATRYFFVSRSASSHLDFDIGLAKTLGNSNPVYYAQYTHARFVSIYKKGLKKNYGDLEFNSDLLVSDEEKTLIKYLQDFTNVVLESAKTLEPYKICNYIQQVCTALNYFYQKNKVLDDKNKNLSLQRLGLVYCATIVLKNALNLIGVSAPDVM